MKQPITSMGIDVSATATGLLILAETGEAHPEVMFAEEIKPKTVGMIRAREIVTRIMEVIHVTKPDKIVVEGYSLGKNMNSTIPLVEIGGLLRFMLHLDEIGWFDPRASEVKKFATGKGNSPKDVVMMWVLKRWGYTSETNNLADAYVLAAMGLAHANRLPGITKEMRALVGALKLRKH
jgi:crossover junction endodeoxyribonuclease RuvC